MRIASRIVVLLAACCCAWTDLHAQKPDKSDKSASQARLLIEVTAGDHDKPVENASVYVKFNDPKTNKQVALDLKTSPTGKTHSPEIPPGKVLVQVIAPGWKTFGRWYDVDAGAQDIKIHLDKPPKWY
jgi:hypothetical protein